MKTVILSESPADEAAIEVLLAAVVPHVEVARRVNRRGHGVGNVLRSIDPTLRELHYRRTADALVVVVDSNASPPHAAEADMPCGQSGCRLCRVRRSIAETLASLKPVSGFGPIRTAVGLAVPAIEAWCLCGAPRRAHVSENIWTQAMREGRQAYSQGQLKEWVYGTERPSLELATNRGTEEMRRVVGDMALLERSLPVGFGALLRDLRGWSGKPA